MASSIIAEFLCGFSSVLNVHIVGSHVHRVVRKYYRCQMDDAVFPFNFRNLPFMFQFLCFDQNVIKPFPHSGASRSSLQSATYWCECAFVHAKLVRCSSIGIDNFHHQWFVKSKPFLCDTNRNAKYHAGHDLPLECLQRVKCFLLIFEFYPYFFISDASVFNSRSNCVNCRAGVSCFCEAVLLLFQ